MILFGEEHIENVRSGRKFQTRRCWKFSKVKEGSIHYAQRSLRPETRFAVLRILKVWEQKPWQITTSEVEAEGYDSKQEFLDAYYNYFPEADAAVKSGLRKHYVINFEVIELLDEMSYP